VAAVLLRNKNLNPQGGSFTISSNPSNESRHREETAESNF
jgi:hypothetical protein